MFKVGRNDPGHERPAAVQYEFKVVMFKRIMFDIYEQLLPGYLVLPI